MAQPTSYTVANDFSQDEADAVGGRSTLRTAALDAELAGIATTLSGTLANLALNQRDDGEIRDGRVKLFTLGSDVLALLVSIGATPRGDWASGTGYALKDLAVSSGNTYIAVVAHTSTGSFATDLAAGKWILFAVGTAPGAASITFAPTGTLASTNVQTAIEETDTENRALSAAASAAVASLITTLATSAGAAAVGFIQAGTGAVLRTLQAKGREAPSFEDYLAVGDGSTDDSAAIQKAITATNGLLIGTPGKTYKVTATLILHSNITIDLRGSTIEWAGATVVSGNKALKWDNAVFRANVIAPSTVKRNIHIRNGTIHCNDWGCGVSLKQVEGFSVRDLVITEAQAAGVQIADCINGKVSAVTATDCAANPSSGFTASTDLEAWSDGIVVWYGSRAVTVEDCHVINTRVGTGRGGIVVDDAAAGSTESLRKTSAITIRNCYVSGYDRQIHVEYAYATSVRDCVLEFVDSGTKTFNTVIIDWNTIDTLWENNRIRSTKALAMISGSVNVNVFGGSMTKTGADTQNAFSNVSGVLANVKFRSVNISLGASTTNIYRWNALFEDCGLSSTAYLQCSHYESNSKFVACTFTLASMWSTGSGLSTDSLDFLDCSFVGFATTSYIASVTFGSLFVRKAKLEAGDVRIYCTGEIKFADMNFATLPTVSGSPTKVSLDGFYLGSAKPSTGTWAQGDLMRNTACAAGGTPFFECVTTGTPGTWKNHATIEA